MYCYLFAQQVHPCSHIISSGELHVSQWGQDSLSVLAWEPFWETEGICPHLNAPHIVTTILFKNYLLNRGICEDPPLHTNAPIRFHPTHLINSPAGSCKCHCTLARSVPWPSCQGQHKALLPFLLWAGWQWCYSLLNAMKRKDHEKPFTGISDQTQDFIIRICFVKKEHIGQDYLSPFCDRFREIFPTGQIQKCVGN